MSASIETQTLDFVAATGKALEAAEKIAAAQEKTDAVLAELSPKLASQLVGLGLIDSTVQETAVERLKDPVKLAESFDRVLKHLAKTKTAGVAGEKAGSDLGTAVPTSSAPAANDNYTGRRRPLSEKAASDEPLLRMAGIN